MLDIKLNGDNIQLWTKPMPRKKTISISERRQSIRAKRALTIQYRRLGKRSSLINAEHHWLLSNTEDMCVSGISFYSDLEFKPREKVDLRVVLSGIIDIYDGVATVVRCEPQANNALFLTAVTFTPPKKFSNKN
jgi:hypothetical protein